MSVLDVDARPYDRPLSTVFGSPDKLTAYMSGDDEDPIIQDLRMLNYRYVRFYFHPMKDKFVLGHGWKDPLWTGVRAVRVGIDNEDKTYREIVFGNNLVDIEQKSIFRLLVDEVGFLKHSQVSINSVSVNTQPGFPSLLRIPDCQLDTLVDGPILLLRYGHFTHVGRQYHHHAYRNTIGKRHLRPTWTRSYTKCLNKLLTSSAPAW